MSELNIQWQIKSFEQLSVHDLYAIMVLRQTVFVIEQNAPYLDADGLDFSATHIMGFTKEDNQPQLVAYLRILPPHNARFSDLSIGRVVTNRNLRRQGLGKELMRVGLIESAKHYPEHPIRISAQSHLEHFYGQFGFETVSQPYLEDNIPHVEMLRK